MTLPSAQFTRVEARAALETAARASLRAPSVFNTQPWNWRISGDQMELFADPERRLGVTDSEGRLLLLSCGGALHHARVALAADGWAAETLRLPDERHPDLLARIKIAGRGPADPGAKDLAAAIIRRRTDRRAFAERRIPEETLTGLRRLVEAEGAHLHVVPDDRVPELARRVDQAAEVEHIDPAYQTELTRWTHRPAWVGDGVPPATAVQPAARRVPMRDFAPDGTAGLLAGAANDEGAAYVILFGTGERPNDLLCAGEAMSALLLAATARGVSSAPISEAVEIAWPRMLLRRLLSGIGEPYLIVRLGYADSPEVLPATPRRAPSEVIRIVE